MHYVLDAKSVYLIFYSELTLCFANALAFPSHIALHYLLKMNYVSNPLFHLHCFQSCLVEYYVILCAHILICIRFSSVGLVDWPWLFFGTKKENEKNHHKPHNSMFIQIEALFLLLKDKSLHILM